MINDLIDFLKLQPKDIDYYNKYPTALMFVIMLLLYIPFDFLFDTEWIENNSVNILSNIANGFIVTILEAYFLVYWLGRKEKKYSFSTVLDFNLILSISIVIPLNLLGLLLLNFNSQSLAFLVISFIALIYAFYVVVVNLALASGVTKKYALGGGLIIFLIQLLADLTIFSNQQALA
jgi:hypothetical protein